MCLQWGLCTRGICPYWKIRLHENDITVISIFVNPTQFNNREDLEKYPRTLEADVEKIKTVSDAIIVFAPSVDEMYDGNTISSHFSFDGLENQMEGAHRPGHFDGVGTIVKKLFEIVTPSKSLFWRKRFPAVTDCKENGRKNHMPVKVIGCPITREAKRTGHEFAKRQAFRQ